MDPRTLPREKRLLETVSSTATNPDKTIRNPEVFSKTLVPPQQYFSSDDELLEILVHPENTSSEAPTAVDSDQQPSVRHRSTLFQALNLPVNQGHLYCSDNTSEITIEDRPAEPTGLATLSISRRETIRKYFSETKPVNIIQGHSTIALTQDQIGHNLRIVADENARSSYEMMDCIIRRASELNPNSGKTAGTSRNLVQNSPGSEFSDVDIELESTKTGGTRYSETSASCRSDDEANNIGYTYEYLPSTSSVVQVSQPPVPGCSRTDPGSYDSIAQADIPGAQTLADIKQEATKEKAKRRASRLPAPN